MTETTTTASSAILHNQDGAPVLPEGVAASISHKRHMAVALVQPGCDGYVGAKRLGATYVYSRMTRATIARDLPSPALYTRYVDGSMRASVVEVALLAQETLQSCRRARVGLLRKLTLRDRRSHHRAGVDIELPGVRRRKDLRRRVLTPQECDNLGGVPGVSEEEEVLLRFSMKEAVYKAAHPFLRRPLGFKDVSASVRKTRKWRAGTRSCLIDDNLALESTARTER